MSFEPFMIQASALLRCFRRARRIAERAAHRPPAPARPRDGPRRDVSHRAASHGVPLPGRGPGRLAGARSDTVHASRVGARQPEAPLSHHSLDSTHITPGVVTGGIEVRRRVDRSLGFRGEEPDDNRLNIERPRLDSWSARIGWRHGPWDAQLSGGHLHDPEWFEPYLTTRLTASVGFDGSIMSRPLAATAAWGENREDNGIVDDSYLLDGICGRPPHGDVLRPRRIRSPSRSLGLGGRTRRASPHPHFTAFHTSPR